MAFFDVDLQRECMINYRQCLTLRNNSVRKKVVCYVYLVYDKISINFTGKKKFHWAAFCKTCVVTVIKALGSFRRRFWPKCLYDSWKAFACRIKRTFTSIATLVCVYSGSSLFSPTPPPVLKVPVHCFFARWWSPQGRGGRLSWAKEATQNYSTCVSYKNLERKAACYSFLPLHNIQWM